MEKARWIWYPGDYELYHSLLLHSRREDHAISYPCLWELASPYSRVNFQYEAEFPEAGSFRAISNGAMGDIRVDNVRWALDVDVPLSAGKHTIQISLMKFGGLPCLYINSSILVTGTNWRVNHAAGAYLAPACTPAYYEPEQNPEVFPFCYQRIDPVTVEEIGGGTLYDFGKEMFSCLMIENASADNPLLLTYGESREEALDERDAIIRRRAEGNTRYCQRSCAFRYVFCRQEKGGDALRIWADYEYLPLEDRASFSCDREKVQKIWDVCAYTFHLNSREFYLDGIKRDRWVWSGDAYQSYMVNNYLYFDPEITKRTIRALLGKPPYAQHINTINDYTLYVIISVYEYYFSTGDLAFVQEIFDRVKALYDFAVSRLDDDGFLCARPGDWVFIDWTEMDRTGPIAAEQILLWQASQSMARLAALCGQDGNSYRQRADALRPLIFARYWNEEKGGFVDSFQSGLNHITRHANIFALLYDFVDEAQARRILKNVLHNPEITAITTPYFKFYELMALCKMGDLAAAQEMIDSYWGGMLDLGATSIWEQYIPEETGTLHYAMYEEKYGRSLCHAWGSGPIYLLGRYCLGVYPTSPGYKTFTVEPRLGLYHRISGAVPLPEGGIVKLSYTAGRLTVFTDREGGILRAAGREYALPVGKNFEIRCVLDERTAEASPADIF